MVLKQMVDAAFQSFFGGREPNHSGVCGACGGCVRVTFGARMSKLFKREREREGQREGEG